MHSFVSWQGIWKEKICWILYCVAIFHDVAVAFVVREGVSLRSFHAWHFARSVLRNITWVTWKELKRTKQRYNYSTMGTNNWPCAHEFFSLETLCCIYFCIIWNWMQNILWLSYAAIKRAWNSPFVDFASKLCIFRPIKPWWMVDISIHESATIWTLGLLSSKLSYQLNTFISLSCSRSC